MGSPILTGLSELTHPPSLNVHSIIAVGTDSPPGQPTDGVVSNESALIAGAASEKPVSAGHLCQDNPDVISEVRRILREHLVDTGSVDRGVSPRRNSGSRPAPQEVGTGPPPASRAHAGPSVIRVKLRFLSIDGLSRSGDVDHVGPRLAKPDHAAVAHGVRRGRADDPDPRVPRAV